MLKSKRILTAVVGTAIILGSGMVGCSTDSDPTAPSTSSSDSQWAEFPESGDASTGLFDRIRSITNSLIHLVVEIIPGDGGVLESGPFELIVPPGALDYVADYEMSHTRFGYVQVDLGPHGAEFDAPVTLNVDLSGTGLARYDDITLYWWDEDAEEWVDVGGTWDPDSNMLSTELEHFSRYRPGRAGW